MNNMERAERYDPEDLEHLMLERSFDELLEEERAYALRHLADRAEYERMRALLHHVREDKRDHAPMDADPAVRERVLAAFRVQQRPQWRIWLNSVGGFLLPARPSLYWRPALALGTVAVLIFGSLMTWNAMEPKGNKVLAEVKQQTPAPAAPAEPATALEAPKALLDTERNTRFKQESSLSNAVTTTLPSDKRLEQAEAAEAPASAGALAKDALRNTDELAKVATAATGSTAEQTLSGYAQSVEEERAPAAEAVRKQEQQVNRTSVPDSPISLADVGVSKATRGGANDEDKNGAASPAYSEDDLLGLLRAAW